MVIWKHMPRARRSPSKASFIQSFTECYSKPFNDPVVQAFIAFDQQLRPSDLDELAEHMHGDSNIKFLFSHYAHFFKFQGDAYEAETALEQWVCLKVTIIKNKTLCSMKFKGL